MKRWLFIAAILLVGAVLFCVFVPLGSNEPLAARVLYRTNDFAGRLYYVVALTNSGHNEIGLAMPGGSKAEGFWSMPTNPFSFTTRAVYLKPGDELLTTCVVTNPWLRETRLDYFPAPGWRLILRSLPNMFGLHRGNQTDVVGDILHVPLIVPPEGKTP